MRSLAAEAEQGFLASLPFRVKVRDVVQTPGQIDSPFDFHSETKIIRDSNKIVCDRLAILDCHYNKTEMTLNEEDTSSLSLPFY